MNAKKAKKIRQELKKQGLDPMKYKTLYKKVKRKTEELHFEFAKPHNRLKSLQI